MTRARRPAPTDADAIVRGIRGLPDVLVSATALRVLAAEGGPAVLPRLRKGTEKKCREHGRNGTDDPLAPASRTRLTGYGPDAS
jgi:hypothetical protein